MSWKLYPISEFESFQNDWQRINLEAAASPLLSLEFVLPLLRIFGSGDEILACYEHEHELQAMAIIRASSRWTWTTFQPSQAPLGAWVQKSDLDWSELLSTLIKQLPNSPLILGITQQDPDLIPRPRNSNVLRTLDYIQTARISIQGNFDDYWNARGKNLRQNMKKQRNKLAKSGITTRLELCTSAADVSHAIIDYGKLESSGWKAKEKTAIHHTNSQGLFYRTMLEKFCNQGKGRIYRYWFNDKIVAMDLCIEGKDNIVILKTTYDEGLGHAVSPAFLMREEECKHLFSENKLKRIEFYGSVMDWHKKWSDEIRTLYHVNNYRWAILPVIHNAIVKTKSLVSQHK